MVLFLVDQLTELGGGERMLFELARSLPTHGFRTAVITFRGHPDPAAFALCDNLSILPFSSCFSMGAVRVAAALRRFIRQHQVSIVQTFFETADTFGALVARLAGVAHIVSSRRDMGILRSAKHRAAYRLMARTYSAVVAVSDQVRRQHLQSDRLQPRQVHTIYNGLAAERFALTSTPDPHAQADADRKAFHLPAGVPLITTVANINPWKGIDVFLRAAALVHSTHPATVFAIAGDWTDSALVTTLHTLAYDLGIAPQVHFLGRVADVAPLLRTSDIFALLSRSEGFPNVVLEAMAAGLPVVATAVGGTPEAVTHSKTGFLVPNEDAPSAAGHMQALLSDPVLAQSMGLAARTLVEQNFSMQHMTEQHVELYHALLRSR